ncbi:hypothetical protein KMW28_01650 [Flammeovirga yaeyamensis]|uniref:SGNH hydrolase-type esterase domain-containing protein n=1 Tax=Flammeovirga yaeyamensis TaxID=367791 RepID=A0AAX1N7U9_9BACT|nr:GDSL-type esterase/lipase family protein [Flammeovirga yaeyamensis]MBB3699791.1 lysophospholipase L1-like esterase [Flammeovirga yaeyamensis]NMF36640.1 hypothetical protein [Flammeovirga yaeyamensis]QWG02315.1 hypothetical protein KMW28_01650 [Flammeovirga yaeyamensis]
MSLQNKIRPFIGLLTVLILVAHATPKSGNNKNRPFVAYDFIRMDLNQLQPFGDTILYPFYRKLKNLSEHKEGHVKILHLGDSHIQADLFSGWVRQRFYENPQFQMSGRGFIFPFKAVKTNNPYNYKVSKIGEWKGQRCSISYHKSNWGAAGITAHTNQQFAKINVNVSTDSIYSYSGNRVDVYYPVNDKTQFTPVVQPLSNNARLQSVEKHDQYVSFKFDKAIKEFRLSFRKENKHQTQFSLRGFDVENDKMNGLTYSSVGVNGAKATSFLRCKELNNDLKAIQPDLIILSLGTNDAFVPPFYPTVFYQKYLSLIEEIQTTLPEAAILITTPGDNLRKSRYINKDNVKAIQELYKVAQERNLAVWDFFQVMGGLSSINKWNEKSMTAGDKVHLNRSGYQYQGELLYRAIISDYNKFTTYH